MFYKKRKIQKNEFLIHKFSKKKLLNNIFNNKKSILLAISGGQDSITLLFLFYFFKQLNNWRIGIVHCNHMWQSEAIRNASKLSLLVKQLNFNYYEATSTIAIRNEEEGRLWRYKIITKIAHSHDYELIMTGHTASDDIETLTGSFLRNCKFKNITPRKKTTKSCAFIIQYFRPLLEFSRLETKLFCHKYNLPVQVDLTNKNIQFKRNRIRQELLPYLRKFFNPNFDNALFYTSRCLTGRHKKK